MNTLAAADCIVNSDIYFTSGDASGQGATITDYNQSTKVVTFTPAITAPSSGSTYSIGPKVVISGDGQSANARATVNSTGSINAVTVVAGGNDFVVRRRTSKSQATGATAVDQGERKAH